MKLSKTMLAGVVMAALLIGGGVVYLINDKDDASQDNETEVAKPSQSDESAAADQESEPSRNNEDDEATEVIDGVAMPVAVINQIKKDYPDYIIEDVDRETRSGEVYYEVELEHRNHPANESEYDLLYDSQWNLIDREFDRD